MLRLEGPSPPSFPLVFFVFLSVFLQKYPGPQGWVAGHDTHLYGSDGLPAAVKSGRHQCPKHVCLSVERGPPQMAVSSMCPAGPPCPSPCCLGACMCAQRVCRLWSCGRVGARRCGPSGQGFKGRVLCPEPNPGPERLQAWDPTAFLLTSPPTQAVRVLNSQSC